MSISPGNLPASIWNITFRISETIELTTTLKIIGIIKKFLSAKIIDDDIVSVWCEVLPGVYPEKINFILIPTGVRVPFMSEYISTVTISNGITYHLYANTDESYNMEVVD